MKKGLLVGAVLLLSVGCATTHVEWRQPGATQQDFARHKYICVQQARVSYFAYGNAFQVLAAQMDAEQQSQQLFNMCLEAHGWRGIVVPNK